MNGRYTLTIIKPGAVRRNFTGAILGKISEAGFRFVALKMLQMTEAQARSFYAVHEGKPFYEGLVQYMISGPVVVAILEKEDAVEAYRNFIGSTDPSKAAAGTIRQLYGSDVRDNAVHGSDSDEHAQFECNFFFSLYERFPGEK
ncbi:MAG: nucleoside-diphosphate kinase [Bacteroidales bacterium]|nr:nucleoside-diphosphate kinase [Bacteroidales bacterium]